ncbi:hypothetical protein ATERTT37_005185, partial [Aspergillus terreus]
MVRPEIGYLSNEASVLVLEDQDILRFDIPVQDASKMEGFHPQSNINTESKTLAHGNSPLVVLVKVLEIAKARTLKHKIGNCEVGLHVNRSPAATNQPDDVFVFLKEL